MLKLSEMFVPDGMDVKPLVPTHRYEEAELCEVN